MEKLSKILLIEASKKLSKIRTKCSECGKYYHQYKQDYFIKKVNSDGFVYGTLVCSNCYLINKNLTKKSHK